MLFPDGRFVTGGADGLLKCWKPSLSAGLAANESASPSPASTELVAFADDGHKLLYRTWEAEFNFLFNMNDLSVRRFARPEAGDYAPPFPLIQPGTNELVVNHEKGLSWYSLFRNGKDLAKTRSIDFARPYSAAFDGSGRILVVSNLDQELASSMSARSGSCPFPKHEDRDPYPSIPPGRGPPS
jgi:hypothetical protein